MFGVLFGLPSLCAVAITTLQQSLLESAAESIASNVSQNAVSLAALELDVGALADNATKGRWRIALPTGHYANRGAPYSQSRNS